MLGAKELHTSVALYADKKVQTSEDRNGKSCEKKDYVHSEHGFVDRAFGGHVGFEVVESGLSGKGERRGWGLVTGREARIFVDAQNNTSLLAHHKVEDSNHTQEVD